MEFFLQKLKVFVSRIGDMTPFQRADCQGLDHAVPLSYFIKFYIRLLFYTKKRAKVRTFFEKNKIFLIFSLQFFYKRLIINLFPLQSFNKMPHVVGDEVDDRLQRVVVWDDFEIERAAQEVLDAVGEVELKR